MKNSYLLLLTLFALNVTAQKPSGTPRGYKLNTFGKAQHISMPVFDVASLEKEDFVNQYDKTQVFRFGYNYATTFSPANHGTWITLSNGDRLWQLVITCPGAHSINLGFSNFKLPQGSDLYIYNTTKTQQSGVHTPITCNFPDQLFGTTLISGDQIVVEYYEPQSSYGTLPFIINRVTHRYRKLPYDGVKNTQDFGESGNCNINVNCPIAGYAFDQKRSSVMLVSNGSGFCSGSLVADVPHSGTPYILSANHCGTMDGSTVFWFNWEAPNCTNPSTDPPFDVVNGAIMRANSAGSDFGLGELNSIPPSGYNVYYSGWNKSATPADSAFGIHHPAGDITKFSKTSSPNNPSTYSGAQCWETGMWTAGVTESGSSGSPLYDQDLRIIGQLYGGPSYCGAIVSDLKDYYGRFDISWVGGGTSNTRLSDWLDPNSTGLVTEDGYDPNATSTNLDAQTLSVQGLVSSCNTSFNVATIIKNKGFYTLTSAVITFQLDGTTINTINWSGNLLTNQTDNINYNLTGLAAGNHQLIVTISAPNGGVDGNAINDARTFNFVTIIPNPVMAPIADGFQSPVFPSTNWSVVNGGASDTWKRNTAFGGFGNSSACMYIDNYVNDFRGDEDELVTPFLNLTGVTNATLRFDVAYKEYSTFNEDTLIVKASNDCGLTWTQLYKKGGTTLSTAPGLTQAAFTPNATQWRNETISLSSLSNVNQLKVAFVNKSGYGNRVYIDNINIQAQDVGLNELTESSINILPNPVQSDVTIRSEFIGFDYALIDVMGRIYASGKTISNQTTLHLDALASGVYFIRITQQGKESVKKIVKQ